MNPILIISHACIEEINRRVYRVLAQEFGMDLHLVIPSQFVVGNSAKKCAEVSGEPFPVTVLEPKGNHLRLMRLKGLADLIKKIRPSVILADSDPSTRILSDVIRNSRGAQVWALTNENLYRNYLAESAKSFLHGNVKKTIGGMVTWRLWKKNRGRIDRLFTISNDGTRVMKEMGFKNKITQIPLGFDPQLFKPQEVETVSQTRERLGLTQRTVAYFGRVTPEKGIRVLLEALNQVKDLPWQFLIDNFSDYPSSYSQSLTQLIKDLSLQDRVVYFDSNHNDMPNFMNAVDIAVLPSLSTPHWKEQYGRVIPEAMACGKVVIGSRTGTIPELIGDCGFLFPEGDTQALAQLLRELLLAPQNHLKKIGEKAQERAHNRLSLFTQAEIWANLMGA